MAASSYTNSTKAKVLASAGVAAFVLSNRSCVEIRLRDARMIVCVFSDTRTNPLNTQRVINTVELKLLSVF